MESRESSAFTQAGILSPPSSFSAILQRGMAALSGSLTSPSSPPGLHSPSPMRPIAAAAIGTGLTPSASQPVYPSETSSGMAAQPTPISAHTGGNTLMASGSGEPLKRKRGRPRKYGPDGSIALALVARPAVVRGPVSSFQKRGRGRPRGSGRKQQLAALGRWLAGTAGVHFTPHVIRIAAGEDVAMKIMSFSQQGRRAVCVLSANGALSNVTLGQPATSGGTVTYEGRFEILSLSGSFLPTENSGICSRTGGLSVCLSGPDGRVFGGVAGLLLAASPVQVVLGSFLPDAKKSQSKPGHDEGGAVLAQAARAPFPNIQPSMNETSGVKSESPSTTSSNAHQQEDLSMSMGLHSVGWLTPQVVSDGRRNTGSIIPFPAG